MDEVYKHNVEQKKPNTKEYMHYYFIISSSKTGKTQSPAVMIVVTFESLVTEKGPSSLLRCC